MELSESMGGGVEEFRNVANSRATRYLSSCHGSYPSCGHGPGSSCSAGPLFAVFPGIFSQAGRTADPPGGARGRRAGRSLLGGGAVSLARPRGRPTATRRTELPCESPLRELGCGRWDSNPHGRNDHGHPKPACLANSTTPASQLSRALLSSLWLSLSRSLCRPAYRLAVYQKTWRVPGAKTPIRSGQE
jgi:hypothetical protein